MGVKLGLDARLYMNSGTYASPTWSGLNNVRDLTLNLETGEADVSTRGNEGWRATVSTLKDASLEFELVIDPEDSGFTSIVNAFLQNEPVEFVVLDGPISGEGSVGSQGLRATFRIASFSRNEALEEAVTASVTAKPTYSEHSPVWMMVG
jgi:hypothetical protein